MADNTIYSCEHCGERLVFCCQCGSLVSLQFADQLVDQDGTLGWWCIGCEGASAEEDEEEENLEELIEILDSEDKDEEIGNAPNNCPLC